MQEIRVDNTDGNFLSIHRYLGYSGDFELSSISYAAYTSDGRLLWTQRQNDEEVPTSERHYSYDSAGRPDSIYQCSYGGGTVCNIGRVDRYDYSTPGVELIDTYFHPSAANPTYRYNGRIVNYGGPQYYGPEPDSTYAYNVDEAGELYLQERIYHAYEILPVPDERVLYTQQRYRYYEETEQYEDQYTLRKWFWRRSPTSTKEWAAAVPTFKIVPNPVLPNAVFQLPVAADLVQIYDRAGRLVSRTPGRSATAPPTAGLYFVSLLKDNHPIGRAALVVR